jgi:hypothetical protein
MSRKGHMHIHGMQMNLNPVNPYAAAAEKALATKRSSNTRKRLLKKATEIETPPNPDEGSMVGRWMEDSRYSQGAE